MRCLLLFFFSIPAWGQIEVIESEIRAQLVDGMTHVSVALHNAAERQIQGKLVLEYLNTRSEQISLLSIDFDIPSGKNLIETPFPIPARFRETKWMRLKYQVLLPGLKPQSVGIVDFDKIAAHAMRIVAIPLGERKANHSQRIHVQALHPSTERPQEGVSIRVQYRRGQVEGKTNLFGEATLDLPLAKDDSSVSIRAVNGDFEASTGLSSFARAGVSALIHTDKPLYQAGQTIRARALLRYSNQKVAADAICRVRLITPAGKELDAQTIKSSRFGILGMEFSLPESAVEGQYTIVLLDEGSGSVTYQKIQVRKYVLPEFRVAVHPDKRFYPADSIVRLDLRMTESSGRPVGLGQFKIQASLFGRGSKKIVEGVFGKDGKAATEFPVKDLIADLVNWQSIPELAFQLFAIHPVTGREESKTFYLKLCVRCSHTYVTGVRGSDIVIASRYVDGSPVVGDAIELRDQEKVIGSVKTNRYGLAHLDRLTARNFKVISGGKETPGQVRHIASETLELRTNRNLYKAGEPIEVNIETPRPELPVRLLAYSLPGGELISSQRVDASKGSAKVLIPYDLKFGSVVAIRAASLEEEGLTAFRMVVYPTANPFPLKLETDKKVYRPNESLALRLTGPQAETAFGVAVVDEGLFDRKLAYTLQPFDYFRPASSVAAEYSLEDLVSMRPDQIDSETQVLAALVLSRLEPQGLRLPRTGEITEAYRYWMNNATEVLNNQLSAPNSKSLDLPKDMIELRRRAPKFVEEWRDPWNQPFQFEFRVDRLESQIQLWSSGPDRKFGNQDDLRGTPISRSWFGRLGGAIQLVLDGTTDYPASAEAFEELLAQHGISLAKYHDPFGGLLRLKAEFSKNIVELKILSSGPDKKWQTQDDLVAGSYRGSIFGSQSVLIKEAIGKSSTFPQTEDEFIALLKKEGHDFSSWRDPIGRPFRVILRKAPLFSSEAVSYPIQELEKIHLIEIRTSESGPGALLQTISSASNRGGLPQGKGRIQGRVHLEPRPDSDYFGSPVAGAKLLLDGTYSTVTDSQGRYQFEGVPAGKYKLEVIGNEPYSGHSTQIQVWGEAATIADLGLRPSYQAIHNRPGYGDGLQYASVASMEVTVPVRDDFPETAFWVPELLSDSQGKAIARIVLPGTMSTWRVAVIGSTIDGRVVETSTQVRTHQPLEIDLELPGILTEGDRLELNVPVLSESKRNLSGSFNAQGSGGIEIGSRVNQTVSMTKGEGLASLEIQAAKRSEKAQVKLTARVANQTDSIAKHLVIEPDGEHVARLASGTALQIEVPADLVPGTLKATLSVDGSILAMLAPMVESQLKRSYNGGPRNMAGAAYLNIYLLDALLEAGIRNPRLEGIAKRNLEETYRQLIDSMDVREYTTQEELRSTYVTDFLKAANRHIALNASLQTLVATAKAPTYLARIDANATPVQLAEFILYQLSLSRPAPVDDAAQRLRAMAIENRLWRNTTIAPDKTWGRGGEFRTTALALMALTRHANSKDLVPHQDPLLRRAADYLMESRDEYGGWLNAELSAEVIISLIEVVGPLQSVPYSIPIRVNGQALPPIVVTDLERPMELDMTTYLKPGQRNDIVLSPPRSGHPARARFIAKWVEPWKTRTEDKSVQVQVSFSKTEAIVGERIEAVVHIRSPFEEGLVAVDVGLPPGAEVDLSSLKRLGGVHRVDATPTGIRLVVQPMQNGDAIYRFEFRPRFVMEALSRPTSLIGLMNRELRATQGPLKFRIMKSK